MKTICIEVDVIYLEVVPVYAAVVWSLSIGVVGHGESHVFHLDFLDLEYLLVVLLGLWLALELEHPGEVVGLFGADPALLQHQVHPGILENHFVNVDAPFVAYDRAQVKVYDDVSGAYKSVDDFALGVSRVYGRACVAYYNVLEDDVGERLDVDSLERDLSLDVVGKRFQDFVAHIGLDHRCLHEQNRCHHDDRNDDERQPDYFERLFDNFSVLFFQLAKIIKISEKIRIFAPRYAKHIICLLLHQSLLAWICLLQSCSEITVTRNHQKVTRLYSKLKEISNIADNCDKKCRKSDTVVVDRCEGKVVNRVSAALTNLKQYEYGRYNFRNRIIMRRHIGCRHQGRLPSVQCPGQSGCA